MDRKSRATTQRITAIDIANGRIRIPIGQKHPFPDERGSLEIRLRGVSLHEVDWDPRLGADRERSGVLYVGTRLAELVQPDERLAVERLGSIVAIGGEEYG